jgi:uncharacterized protein
MRAIAWIKERGAEFAEVDLGRGGLRATGVAVGGDPVPYRLEYELDCGDDFVTRRLSVRAWGAGWGRHLELGRDRAGIWSAEAGTDGEAELLGLPGVPGPPPPGADPADLDAALDCDLGLSPLTNTMPVLRHGLLDGGGPVEFLMAWVSVPWLAVTPSRQRYTHLRRGTADELGLALPAGAGEGGAGEGGAGEGGAGGDLSLLRFQAGDFSADVAFDAQGLVVDYPEIGRLA